MRILPCLLIMTVLTRKLSCTFSVINSHTRYEILLSFALWLHVENTLVEICNELANELLPVCSKTVNKLCSHCMFSICCNNFGTSS